MLGQVIFQANGETGLGKTGLAVCRTTVGLIIGATMLLFVQFFWKELHNVRKRRQTMDDDASKGSSSSSQDSEARNTFSNPNPMHVQQHAFPTHLARSAHVNRFHDSTSDIDIASASDANADDHPHAGHENKIHR